MIIVDHIESFNFEGAIRSLRNPKNSWEKSDSRWEWIEDPSPVNPNDSGRCYVIGEYDLELMKKLYKAGVEHRTYARMIQTSMDIVAPLYFWKEMDRYTVGKTQISTSTMHKIHDKEFTLDDFSHEHINGERYIFTKDNIQYSNWDILYLTIQALNENRKRYLETKDKNDWWQLIQLLPSSYNQRRTICMSYETVFKIIKERSGHKLDEWREFCDILRTLPYVKEIMEDEDGNS